MIIGVPRDTAEGEKRVALVPESAAKLAKAGFEILVEDGAGDAAGFLRAEYEAKGAKIVARKNALAADIVLQVNPLSLSDADSLKESAVLISLVWPHQSGELLARLAARKVSALALDRVPRITRAQSVDVLSSMSSLAGYKCVLEAANLLPKIFPMMMTAAGTIAPAKVFILGAGVAGLQAIATARRLGAVVEAFDVRPAVKEEVQSLGAKFVQLELETGTLADKSGYAKEQSEDFLRKQRELMAKHIAAADIVITTALVPGKKAPVLVTKENVASMRPGSVIVDLAAEQGGNCELSEAGRVVEKNGVRIIGMKNVASSVAFHASQLFSRNLATLILMFGKDGKLSLDPKDEIIAATLATHEGRVCLER